MGLPLPECFLQGNFLDYKDRGRIIWEELFDAHREHFKKKAMKYSLDIDKFCRNQKDRESKINFIPLKCVKEGSHVLILYKSKFKNFIQRGERKNVFAPFRALRNLVVRK